jgi:hypothetical protein
MSDSLFPTEAAQAPLAPSDDGIPCYETAYRDQIELQPCDLVLHGATRGRNR